MIGERIYGLVIGLVSDVDDPENLGRVKLKYPEIAENIESTWTRIAWPMAGEDRGFYFMPEVDDEAVVAFQHGSIDHPMVLGFLHNAIDVPPNSDIDVHVRRFKSVTGHVLEFDDREGQERVRFATQGSHFLEMKDPEGTVELRTNGSQQILMQDTPKQIKLTTSTGTTITIDDAPSQVEVKTVGGVSITVSDTGGVTVSAATGAVTVNALSATLNATSSATINAPTLTANGAALSFNSGIATFSGVVQCTTLIASSVVSPVYTPGVGNLI